MSPDDLFISPGVDVGTGSPLLTRFANLTREELRDRWNTPKGREILQKWEAESYDRLAIQRLIGTFYEHLDLRGISLAGRRLTRVDLSKVDFFIADLAGADLSKANLSDSYLSEANILGTRLDWAQARGLLLDNVKYDLRTSFLGVDLHTINFTLAALLHDMAVTQQRIHHLETRSPLLAWFLRVTSEYGLSLPRYFVWVLAIVLLFALAFAAVPNTISQPGLWNAIYFSVVTFTTLGYGDIYPASVVGQLFAIAEVCTGYLMGGLLIAILARRVMLG